MQAQQPAELIAEATIFSAIKKLLGVTQQRDEPGVSLGEICIVVCISFPRKEPGTSRCRLFNYFIFKLVLGTDLAPNGCAVGVKIVVNQQSI